MRIALIYAANDAYSSDYAALSLGVLQNAGIEVTEFPLEDPTNETLLQQSLHRLRDSGLRVIVSPLLLGAMTSVYEARNEVDVVSPDYFWLASSSWAGFPATGLSYMTGCDPLPRHCAPA